jgi:hypothetical protein
MTVSNSLVEQMTSEIIWFEKLMRIYVLFVTSVMLTRYFVTRQEVTIIMLEGSRAYIVRGSRLMWTDSATSGSVREL